MLGAFGARERAWRCFAKLAIGRPGTTNDCAHDRPARRARASTDVDLQETPVDGPLTLAQFPSELLVMLAEMLGNPLALLVSKAHLSKAFREAAGNAQAILTHADLRTWSGTVDDACVAAVVSKSTLALNLGGCDKITDEAVVAVASRCPQLTMLDLYGCDQITDAAVVAVASRCPLLTTLDLGYCRNITDEAVVTVASIRPLLTTHDLWWAATSPTRRWGRWPRGARSSRRSTWPAAAISPTRR